MNEACPEFSLWKGQAFHFACLVALLGFVSIIWNQLGAPAPVEFWIAVLIPVFHQIFVWLAWRLELLKGSVSQRIGFDGYQIFFFVLFASRFLSLFVIAWADKGSLGLHAVLVALLTIGLALPGFYAMYSVIRYFGMARAAGGDHFDEKYRNMPLVNEGIFKFTKNGMYRYAFLLFWAIAIAYNSSAALLVAAYSHLYIWVHYYATEKPDMEYIYEQSETAIRTINPD